MTYRVSPETLANDDLRKHHHQEKPTWRQSFDALLARVQANSMQISSDEIEADISVAAEEARKLRHLPDAMRDEQSA